MIPNTRIPAKPRIRRSRLYRALHHIPILLFKRLPCALGDLNAEDCRFACLHVAEVHARVLALEARRVKDVRTSMFDRWECWWLGCDFRKGVEELREL